jgi:hypothetical protein
MDQMELGEFLGFGKNNPTASVGEFYVEANQQVESRKERIRTLLMLDPGPYVKTQEALLDLMRKENEFVRTQARFFGVDSEYLDKTKSVMSQLALLGARARLTGDVLDLTHDKQAASRSLCQEATEGRELAARNLTNISELERVPTEAEIAQHEAINSWNKAYGWILWSGVSLESTNPIRTHPPVLSSKWIAMVERNRPQAEMAMKKSSDLVKSSCQ